MYSVFNSEILNRNQRFIKALIAGSIAAVAFALAFAFLTHFITKYILSFLYIFIGMGIGTVIQRYGHGVQLKFSILGAVLTILSFILFHIFLIIFSFPAPLSTLLPHIPEMVILLYSDLSLSTFFFQGLGVFAAFDSARIL